MKRNLQIPRVLVLIETSRNFGRLLLEGVGRYSREYGHWSFYIKEQGLDELSRRKMDRRKIDGVISRLRNSQAARRLQATGLPFVEVLGNPITGQPHVAVAEDALARMAACHLLERGLKHLGFFAERKNEWWCERRHRAFVTQVARSGHACTVYEAPPSSTWSVSDRLRRQRSIVQWLKSLPKPSGVLCATDMDALALLEICRQIGIAVPDQIAVLGVDNDSVLCSLAWPRLSSIELDGQRMGYEAATLLARMMGGKSLPTLPILVPPTQIVARESTDVLTIADAKVVQALRLIRQFACQGIDVSYVADHIAMSRRMLERRFRAGLGRTLNEEILRVKMDQAKMLLSQSDYPAKRIGSMCGFGSLHYFARAFRRETGETPGHYRQRTRLSPSKASHEPIADNG